MDILLEDICESVSVSDIIFQSEDADRNCIVTCLFNVILPSYAAQRLGIARQFVFRFNCESMDFDGQSADGRKLEYSTSLGLGFGPPDEPPAYSRCRSKPDGFIGDLLSAVVHRGRERSDFNERIETSAPSEGAENRSDALASTAPTLPRTPCRLASMRSAAPGTKKRIKPLRETGYRCEGANQSNAGGGKDGSHHASRHYSYSCSRRRWRLVRPWKMESSTTDG